MSAVTMLSGSSILGQTTSSEEYRLALDSQGYVRFSDLTTPDEVAFIRSTLSGLLSNQVGAREGKLFDTMASEDDAETKHSLQLSHAGSFVPELLDTAYVRNATRMARELLSPDCVLRMDFALVKLAHVGTGTPWHQDEAYRDSRLVNQEITFWLALQDVGVDSGCMLFVPGSHKAGILDHRSQNNDPSKYAIECAAAFSEDDAVPCPLKAGECTAHDQRTLHCTRDNVSDTDRYAYILVFGMASPPVAAEQKLHPWIEKKRIADLEARKQKILRRGVVGLFVQKIRRGEVRSFSDLKEACRRGLDALRGRY